MKILLANTAGFCMGVRRAMQTVLGQMRKSPKPVRTHGPLIHNPQVIEMLRGKGIEPLDKKQPFDGKGTVVIRAHGITPTEKQELGGCGFCVVDATCPHVIRIQRLIAKHVAAGEHIIIVGDHGHAEVMGLLGYAQGKGYVVATEEDVAALPDMPKVYVVSQTTQSESHFENLLACVQKRWPDCQKDCTICNSTEKRQAETIRIANMSDAMVVVGGKNSANTVRLAELAAETGTPTFHIETSDELDLKQLHGKKTVGLTAGASTPNWMIVEVAERLKEAALQDEPFLKRHVANFIKFLLNTHLFAALGAFGLGLGCAVLYPHAARASFPFVAIVAGTLYIFAMHTLNIRSERDTERYTDPLRWRFHLRFGRVLLAFGLAAAVGSLALSFRMNIWAFGLMSLAVITGVLHRLTFVPRILTPFFGRRRLAEIPGSKDLFMGGAWAVVLAALPLFAQLSNGSPLDVLTEPRSLLNA
ncbi:TPA: 4-hydroxy-3-methylbut-2-enyl diphosphate reductase, partial [Candidatus Sumerlaeota bacterium]|nr:4-hydroxy-3-methylbut-2-enyl diphosphate reductase [Candidatus Sumerlaeota bacterium]